MYRKQRNKLQRSGMQPASASAAPAAAAAPRGGGPAKAASVSASAALHPLAKSRGMLVAHATLNQQQQRQHRPILRGPRTVLCRLKARALSSGSGSYKQRLHGPARRLVRKGDQLYVVGSRTLTRGGVSAGAGAAAGGVSTGAKVRMLQQLK